MAYFQSNQQNDGRGQAPAQDPAGYDNGYMPDPAEEEYDGYDDGFDDLLADEPVEDERTEKEKADIRKRRVRLLFGAGNLTGIILGSLLILLLLALLFSMINFLIGDISKNFTLFQTRF